VGRESRNSELFPYSGIDVIEKYRRERKEKSSIGTHRGREGGKGGNGGEGKIILENVGGGCGSTTANSAEGWIPVMGMNCGLHSHLFRRGGGDIKVRKGGKEKGEKHEKVDQKEKRPCNHPQKRIGRRQPEIESVKKGGGKGLRGKKNGLITHQ